MNGAVRGPPVGHNANVCCKSSQTLVFSVSWARDSSLPPRPWPVWAATNAICRHWQWLVRVCAFSFSFVKIQITYVCVLFLLFFTAADLFTDLENAFQGKIDAAYFETSKYLLDVLNKKYSLLDHMQAMRRYLLLGQGDFIRHLMDLLKYENHFDFHKYTVDFNIGVLQFLFKE